MPEIKNTFTSGKMNKDLDERLVPKNEYRDALNIDIANSEASDVGSAQNSYGNLVKSNTGILGAKCVGTVLYPNNSIGSTSVIWFVAGTDVNAIVEYFPDQQTAVPILIDVKSVATNVNGAMGSDDDTFFIDSPNGLFNNVRIGMDAVTSDDAPGFYPKVKQKNISTTQTNGSSTSNSTTVNLSSANHNIRAGQTVTSTNISNSVTVSTIVGTTLTLSGAPGGTIAVAEELTFTSTNSITIDDYRAFADDFDVTFKDDGFLKFDINTKITAINVLDGLLFWTDGVNEPKKINIESMKSGCNTDQARFFDRTTVLKINGFRKADTVTEKDITVIKKYPLNSPNLEMAESIRTGKITASLTTPANTSYSAGGDIHARGSGNKVIHNKIFQRPSSEQAEIGQRIIRFSPVVTTTVNIMQDGIHYKDWRSVSSGMTVLVDGVQIVHSTLGGNPIRWVDYENHCIHLPYALESVIPSGSVIEMRYWLNAFKNESFWCYRTEGDKILPKLVGTNCEAQTGLVDGQTNSSGLLGRPMRIQELQFDGQPNFLTGDIIKLIAPNPLAAGNEDPEVEVKVKLLDEVISTTSLMEPATHASAIANVGSERIGSSGNISFSGSNDWELFTMMQTPFADVGDLVTSVVTNTNAQGPIGDNYLEFASTDLSARKLFAILPKNKISPTADFFQTNKTYKIEVKFDMASYVEGSIRGEITVGGASGAAGVNHFGYDINLETSAIVSGNPGVNATSVTLTRENAGIEVGMQVRHEDTDVGRVSAISGGALTLSNVPSGTDLDAADVLTFHTRTGTKTCTFYIHTLGTKTESGIVINPYGFKGNVSTGSRRYPTPLSGIDDNVLQMEPATGVAGAPQTLGTLRQMITPGMRVTGTNVPPDTFVIHRISNKIKTNNDVSGVGTGAELTFSASFQLKAMPGFTNDNDINLRVNNFSFKECDPTIGNGFGFKGTNTFGGFSRKVFNAEITTIADKIVQLPQDEATTWSCEIVKGETLFEDKFPRFAYRWMYSDGEYSAISPFSKVAFLPNSTTGYEYDGQGGFNVSMQNNVRSLKLVNFDKTPLDVTEFQLLYKESDSTNIYHYLSKRGGELEFSDIEITSETVNAVLPSNQLLRPYDNVPKSAKAQEISANRLIYANYKQQYDMVGYNNDNAKFDYIFKNVANNIVDNKPKESMKAFRSYDLGVSLLDKYGRQTPVFSNDNRQIKLKNRDAKQGNFFEALVSSRPEEWATHYKYYVHDKHNDHYNMALDRFYPAETREHVWLSFVSSDANKVQEDDFIILKKVHDSNDPVPEDLTVKYKVLEKSSNAPESITGIKRLFGRIADVDFGTATTPATNFPLLGTSIIRLRGSSVVGSELEDVYSLPQGNKYIRIGNSDQVVISNYYKVSSIERVDSNTNNTFNDADDYYDITLETTIGGDTGFVGTSSAQTNNCFIEYYEKVTDEYADEFEGKFFVKILKDDNLTKYILNSSAPKDEIYYTLRYTKQIRWAHVFNTGTDGSGDYHSTGNTSITDVMSDGNTWMLDTYSWSQVYTGGSSSVTNMTGSTPADIAQWAFSNDLFPIYHTLEDSDLDGTVGGGDYTDDQYMCIDSAWSYGASGVLNHGEDYGVGDRAKAGYGFRIGESKCQFRLANVGHQTTGVDDIVTTTPVSSYISSELNGLYQDLETIGTSFRWSDDPDGTVYTINNVSAHGVNQYRHSLKVNRAFTDSSLTQPQPPPEAQTDSSSTDNAVLNGVTVTRVQIGTGVNQYPNNIANDEHMITVGDLVYNLATSAYIVDSNGDSLKVAHYGSYNNPHGSPLYQSASTHYLYFDGVASATIGNNVNLRFFRTAAHAGSNGNIVSNDYFETNVDASDFNNKNNQGWRYDIDLNKLITWSPTSATNQDGSSNTGRIYAMGTNPGMNNTSTLEILKIDTDPVGETFFSENPAVFEVEPQKAIDTNLYYETSNSDIIIKPNMFVSCGDVVGLGATYSPLAGDAIITSVNYESSVTTNNPGNPGSSALNVKIDGIGDGIPAGHKITIFTKDENGNVDLSQEFTVLVGNSVSQTDSEGNMRQLDYTPRASDSTFFNGIKIRPTKLEYFNCYSFGNGVETNRLRDDFNAITIDKGPRVSTTMLDKYMEEHKKHSFIYSGIYNNISTQNNLNQFIQAEKITKDLNPVYGSIQKLFSRNTNLLAFCENKVLKVLSNKDALFNADGNVNITSTNNVLGQAIPFAGDYGISTNPESFASYGYRVYFSDKDRNSVLRLSGDGITDISEKGMKDFFKDNLNEASTIVGSYDINKDLYNLTLNNKTVSFSENVGGWTSLKSFIPENGISISGDYYTFHNGEVWKHTVNTLRGNYYGVQYDSSIKFIFNDQPSIVKRFKTLNYEGTESRKYNSDGELSLSGWYAKSIETDMQSAEVKQFLDKENKWFNYIKGTSLTTANLDSKEFNVQGLGVCSGVSVTSGSHLTNYVHTTRLIPSSEAISVIMVGASYGYIDNISGNPTPADFAASGTAGSIQPATSGGTNNAAGFTVNSTTQITGTIIANDPNSIYSGVRFLRGVVTDLVPGQTYTVSATISGYTKGSGGIATDTHEVGFVDISGIGTTARRNANGQISTTFIAIGKRLDIFKGAYVAAVMSNISIVKENTNLYPRFVINKSLTDLTTADTSITVNRVAGSISSHDQVFYIHGQSVSGQRWNQIASGVTITEVSDPGTNIGTVVKEDGYIKSDGTFDDVDTYQNTATNVIRLTVPVSGTMPANDLTSILSAAVTSNLVQS